MTKNLIMMALLMAVASCHSNHTANQATAAKDSMSWATAPSPKPDLKSLHFDYPKDPACGMPLTAGLEDTTHYKGKLYGFCSKECKDAFLKEPESITAAIYKIKKQ
jgi:YHS domain-containing protein